MPDAHDPMAHELPKPPPSGDELPWSGGPPVESDRHADQVQVLIETVETWLARDPQHWVGHDQALYFSELQSRRNDFRAPDFYVVLGVEPKARKSWVVWEEEGRTPNVIIEVTSPTTRTIDLTRKKRAYESIRVLEYFVYEPHTHELFGWRFAPEVNGYRPIQAEASGRMYCQQLGLELGLCDRPVGIHAPPLLRFFEDGVARLTRQERIELADQRTRAAEAETEQLRAAAEAARQDAENARQQAMSDRVRLAALETELARLRAGTD